MDEDRIFGLPRWQACLIAVALFGALCLNITYIHAGVYTLRDMAAWHADNMLNRAPAPLQYRWLSYVVPDLLSRCGLSVLNAYLVVRFACLAVAIYFIGRVAAKLGGEDRGDFPLVTAFVFVAYYAASVQNHIQPAEELNIAVFAIGIYALLFDRSLWWWPLIIGVGALNKDTVGFLIPYLFLYGWARTGNKVSLLAVCAIVSVEFVAIYLGLRQYFGVDRPYLGGLWQLDYNRYFMELNPFHGGMWLIPSLLPLAIAAFRWKQTPLEVKLFCPTIVLFCVGHLLISKIDEFRTYSVLGVITFPYMLALLLPHGGPKRETAILS